MSLHPDYTIKDTLVKVCFSFSVILFSLLDAPKLINFGTSLTYFSLNYSTFPCSTEQSFLGRPPTRAESEAFDQGSLHGQERNAICEANCESESMHPLSERDRVKKDYGKVELIIFSLPSTFLQYMQAHSTKALKIHHKVSLLFLML